VLLQILQLCMQGEAKMSVFNVCVFFVQVFDLLKPIHLMTCNKYMHNRTL